MNQTSKPSRKDILVHAALSCCKNICLLGTTTIIVWALCGPVCSVSGALDADEALEWSLQFLEFGF